MTTERDELATIHARLDAGDSRMQRIEAAIQANADSTAELVEMFKAWQGAFKVLQYIGKLAKPLGYIAMAVGAVAGAWAAIRGLGK